MSVTLRQPLTLEECQLVRTWRNDPAVLPMLRTGYKTEAEQAAFYRTIIAPSLIYRLFNAIFRRPKHWYYAVVVNGQFAGLGGLTYVAGRSAEISLILGPTFRGRGVGFEAVDKVLIEAFDRKGLWRVTGECYAESPARAFWARCLMKPYWPVEFDYPSTGSLVWSWTRP